MRNKIEEIMKPYFDKKTEIEYLTNSAELNTNLAKEDIDKANLGAEEQINEINLELEQQIHILEARLERIRESKEQEINDYIASLPSQSNFYPGYINMVKADLEQSYLSKENGIQMQIDVARRNAERKISEIKEKAQENEQQLLEKIEGFSNTPDYSNVYLREMVEVKHSIKKDLIATRKEIENQISEEKINFDTVMLEISKFKYEYDEQRQVINGNELRTLFEKSNEISRKMDELKASLKLVEDYLVLMELTLDEGKAIMRSMAPWEKKEYDRRKGLDIPELEEVTIDEIEEPVEETNENEDSKEEDSIKSDETKEKDENISDVMVESLDELSNIIYEDVMKAAIDMDSIKVEETDKDYHILTNEVDNEYSLSGFASPGKAVKLPNGEFINSSDYKKALAEYYKKEKGKKFYIKQIDKVVSLSKSAISKIKKAFKYCTTLRLYADDKIYEPDIKTIALKNRYEEYSVPVGEMSTNLSEGDYVSKNQVIEIMGKLFKERKSSWLRRMSNKFDEIQEKYHDRQMKNLEQSIEEIEEHTHTR